MADSILDHPQFDSVANALELDRGLPLGTLRAVAMQESGGRADANSGKAYGLMQFTPSTAKAYNVDVNNPWDSLRGAADYLGDLQGQHGSLNAALAGYNGGTSQAKLVAAGQDPTFSETKNYVTQVNGRMQKAAPSNDAVVSAIENNVAAMKMQGASDTLIVEKLLQSPVGDVVKQAQSQGFTSKEIVQRMGGNTLAQVQGAQSKVDNQGFLTNLGQGASNAVSDLTGGAQQLAARATGDDAQLQQLQQQQVQAEADPARQAVGSTVGGWIGNAGVKSLPYIAAGAVTGGAALPLILGQTAAGAASGALTPTTGEGQIVGNVLRDAAIGGGTAGAGVLAGKAITGIANKVIGPATDAADRTALIQSAQQQGLPVSASNVSPFWKAIAEGTPNSSAVKNAQGAADAAVTNKIAQGLGVNDWKGAISTDLLNEARPQIQGALDSATGVNVVLPTSMKTDLSQLIQKSTNPLTEGIASNNIVSQAVANLTKAIDTGTAVTGRDLQGLNSELKSLVQTQGVSHAEKQIASDLITKINDSLMNAMTPEQQAVYTAANKQYANLKAVERMVTSSNDTGIVSPRQILQAAKTGRFKSAYLTGDAPYQELGKTAADLYGPANGRGIGDIIAKSVGGHDEGMLAASVLEPTAGLPILAAKKAAQYVLGKLATSQNPTVVRLLSGAGGTTIDPVTAGYIAKALGAGMGGSTS